MNVGRRTWSTIMAALLWVVAPLCAPPASADSPDDAFLGALADYGITINDPDTAISMAQTVCTGFDNNQPPGVLAMKAMKDSNMTAKQAGFFVGLSVSAYCPQYKEQLGGGTLDWLHMPPPNM